MKRTFINCKVNSRFIINYIQEPISGTLDKIAENFLLSPAHLIFRYFNFNTSFLKLFDNFSNYQFACQSNHPAYLDLLYETFQFFFQVFTSYFFSYNVFISYRYKRYKSDFNFYIRDVYIQNFRNISRYNINSDQISQSCFK